MLESLVQYLRLIRLPNVFTAPSNVFVGYFAFFSPSEVDGIQLGGLAVSSALLYISGIVFNDYFDLEIDRIERPTRPLPSGRIRKESAAFLGASAIVGANIIALFSAGPIALGISVILSALIISYDYRLKSNPAAGTVTMATSRSLNVILGATPAFAAFDWAAESGARVLALAAGSLFVYVVTVMILSGREVKGASMTRYAAAAIIVAATIVAIGALGYRVGFGQTFIPMLLAFAVVMALTFWRYRPTRDQLHPDGARTQKIVRNMVLSIIILDSVFVSGTAGYPYGLPTLLLIIPAAVLGKKMYVT